MSEKSFVNSNLEYMLCSRKFQESSCQALTVLFFHFLENNFKLDGVRDFGIA